MKRQCGSSSFSNERTDSNNSTNNRRSSNEGWYDLLQLPRDATPEAIKRTYRQLALLWHPDKGGNVTRFQSLTAAWEVLGNEERRCAYDKQLQRSGSSDGTRFKRRNSWAATTGATANERTTGVPVTRGVAGTNVAATETNTATETTEEDKKSSPEWLLYRRRRYSLGEVFTDTQQEAGGQQRTDFFESWGQEKNSGRITVTTARNTWKSDNNGANVSGSVGVNGISTATDQRTSATTETFVKGRERRSDASSGQVSSARERYSQQQEQQQQQRNETATGYEWKGHRPLEKGTGLTKCRREETLYSLQHSNPVVGQRPSPPTPAKHIYRASSVSTERLFTRADSPVAATPCQVPCKGIPHSSSFPLPAAGGTSATFAAAANAATNTSSNRSRTTATTSSFPLNAAAVTSDTAFSGCSGSNSLEKVEAGLKKVLGEEGCFNRLPSTSSSIHEEVQRLGVKQLKKLLAILSIPHNYCIEKDDLLDAFAEAFPDVIVTRCHNGEPVSFRSRILQKNSSSTSRSHIHSKNSSNSLEGSISSTTGRCEDDPRVTGIDSDDRSDSRSSFSSNDSGIFHKFHAAAAAARAVFAKPNRDATSVAAVVARRKCVQRRLLFPLGTSSSADRSAAVTSSSFLPAATPVPLSRASPQPSCPALSSNLSSAEKKEGTPSHGAVHSKMLRHTVARLGDLSGDVRIKLVAIGGEKTGKSCIIKRYCEGRFVARNAATVALDYGVKVVKVKHRQDEGQGNEEKKQQLGESQQIGEEKQEHNEKQSQHEVLIPVRVNFFDFSGKREFKDIRKGFYEYTDGVLLVYDASRRQTFLELKDWTVEAANLLQQDHSPHQQLTVKPNVWTSPNRKEFFENIQARTPVVMLLGNKVDKEREVQTAEGEAFAREHGMFFFETSASNGHNIVKALETLFEATAARVLAVRRVLAGRLPDLKPAAEPIANCAAAAAATISEEFVSVTQFSRNC